MYKKNIRNLKKIRGITVFYYFFLAVVMVVFVVAMLKSNLKIILKPNMYKPIKGKLYPTLPSRLTCAFSYGKSHLT